VNKITIVSILETPTLTIRFRAAPQDIGRKLGEALPAIFALVQSRELEIVGPPFSRYHAHDLASGTFEIEAGMPLAVATPGEGSILGSELPGGRAAVLIHRGPYETLGESHSKLQEWAAAHELRAAGGPWEEYVTDPGTQPDSAQWETRIVLPILD